MVEDDADSPELLQNLITFDLKNKSAIKFVRKVDFAKAAQKDDKLASATNCQQLAEQLVGEA